MRPLVVPSLAQPHLTSISFHRKKAQKTTKRTPMQAPASDTGDSPPACHCDAAGAPPPNKDPAARRADHARMIRRTLLKSARSHGSSMYNAVCRSYRYFLKEAAAARVARDDVAGGGVREGAGYENASATSAPRKCKGPRSMKPKRERGGGGRAVLPPPQRRNDGLSHNLTLSPPPPPPKQQCTHPQPATRTEQPGDPSTGAPVSREGNPLPRLSPGPQPRRHRHRCFHHCRRRLACAAARRRHRHGRRHAADAPATWQSENDKRTVRVGKYVKELHEYGGDQRARHGEGGRTTAMQRRLW